MAKSKWRRLPAFAVLFTLALAAVYVFGFLPQQTEARLNKVIRTSAFAPSKQASRLHSQLFVADLHADSLLFDRDLLKRSEIGQVDLPRLQAGNVALQMFTVVTKVPKKMNIESNKGNTDQITPLAVALRWPLAAWNSTLARALYKAGRLQEIAQHSSGQIIFIRNRAELEAFVKQRAAGSKAVAAMLGLEGAHALEGKVENLEKLRAAGYRLIGVAHFFDNEFTGSAHGENKYGLTMLGRELIKKMEEARIIVDLAHSSPQTIDDVLVMATRPVVVSHTGVKATCNNRRNLSDDQIRAIAKNGGVIGIGYWLDAVCGTDVNAIVRAIKHTVEVTGVDHVALGSDFDGAVTTPFDTAELARITDALLAEGFSEGDIHKIMGGNVLRFMQENLP